MPTYSCHIPDDETEPVDRAIASEGVKPGVWVKEAVRQRLERDGFIPNTPRCQIRELALAAAEVVGEDRVLAVLQQTKAEALASKAAAVS